MLRVGMEEALGNLLGQGERGTLANCQVVPATGSKKALLKSRGEIRFKDRGWWWGSGWQS